MLHTTIILPKHYQVSPAGVEPTLGASCDHTQVEWSKEGSSPSPLNERPIKTIINAIIPTFLKTIIALMKSPSAGIAPAGSKDWHSMMGVFIPISQMLFQSTCWFMDPT